MLGGVLDALARPDGFFGRDRAVERRAGALVVVVSALVAALGRFGLLVAFRRLFARRELVVLGVALLAVSVGIGLLSRLVVAVALYGLSWPRAEDGRFRDLLAAVGRGWLPQVLTGAVVVAAPPPLLASHAVNRSFEVTVG